MYRKQYQMIKPASPCNNTLLTIIKPLGRPILLAAGEIVAATITDILETGGITLNIKGSFLTARTGVPLIKDSTAFFRVLGGEAGSELRLQFVGYSEKALPAEIRNSRQTRTIERLLQEMSKVLLKEGAGTQALPEAIGKFVDSLAPESHPKLPEFGAQVRQLLRESLDASGLLHAFLPFEWQGLKDADISFRKARRDKDDLFSCRLDLDLAEHGDLSIVLLMINREFLVYLRAGNDAFKEIMRSHIDELKDALAAAGSGTRVIFLDKNSTTEEMERITTGEGLIDINV